MRLINTYCYPPLFSMVAVFLVAFSLLAPTTSRADDLLSSIVQTKTITLSYQKDVFPFSYFEDNKPQGYSIDICHRLVDLLKQELHLSTLKIKWVPVTTATQFLTIKNKSIGMGCIPTIGTVERQKIVTFSEPYFFSDTRFVSRKEDDISDINQLNGHTVMVKSGTVFVKHIQQANIQHQLSLNIDLGTDNMTAFSELESGKLPAIVSSDVLILAQMALSGHPQAFSMSDDALSPRLPIAIPMQKGNPEFTELVNHSLKQLMQSKEFSALYSKWFLQPIMPEGITLNLPLSPELQQSIASAKHYSY
ncbi:periplasmic binding component of a glutamate/aspartate transporter [Buttiauxella brennerae ATCC 51605]|uniref:Periplasmic binding component of a glutamate/aspartate transporter n=2 Tax=Buttiauxella TaxID=82976 RepID=A0A1B7ISF6_9ENTR|nr:periplasmic binding component of a glutamate/aspartate transporter [Buttiauxella brennerae ATCC 51605]